MPPERRDAGYTMMELLMSLTIAAILAAIAIPGFKYVTSSNRIATEVNGLLGDLLFARSEAVKEGQTVTVCASSSPYAACSGTANWAAGWIVFLDTNNSKNPTGQAIVRVQPAFSGTDTFVAAPATFHAITYNRLGYAPTGAVNSINVALHDQASTTAWIRCVAVNPIGSAVTEKYGVGTPACN